MNSQPYDPIRLEVFKHLFSSIAEEMGALLRKASYSSNIKERRDFSCAIFNAQGEMITQAEHIPVHLGSMPLSVKAAIQCFVEPSSNNHNQITGWIEPGDVLILNDPFRGGTHLPDITLITPVYWNPKGNLKGSARLIGFTACRAHHADVGGIAPGSMSIAREIYQEGLIIPPLKIIEAGKMNKGLLNLILANVRTPDERLGDLWAQIASNQRGADRLIELVSHYGLNEVFFYMNELLSYTERVTRYTLRNIPDGTYSFTDYLDDDGIEQEKIPITVKITIDKDQAIVDFTGTAPQQIGSVNAVYAITLSAVYYVFRCLLDTEVPNNTGLLKPIKVIAPQGTIVNATHPFPVAGGNVETSQRIVDVLLGALSRACPHIIPAASQGTMNNIAIGGRKHDNTPFTYYETIGGGMGARPNSDGVSAIHTHMTNTLNTPIEAIEFEYPLRVQRYAIRRGSGGRGKFRGGDGIEREIQLLVDAQVSFIMDRRKLPPYGLAGGECGQPGENTLIRNDHEIPLPSKGTITLKAGDIIRIRTPGGGGYGKPNL
jgi:N-methylhydantoinase B